jgi:hypothetical protein
MAFETSEPLPSHAILSPVRRALAAIGLLAALAGLIWRGDVAYHAQPADHLAQQRHSGANAQP